MRERSRGRRGDNPDPRMRRRRWRRTVVQSEAALRNGSKEPSEEICGWFWRVGAPKTPGFFVAEGALFSRISHDPCGDCPEQSATNEQQAQCNYSFEVPRSVYELLSEYGYSLTSKQTTVKEHALLSVLARRRTVLIPAPQSPPASPPLHILMYVLMSWYI